MRLIGLTGRAGVGKDTVADYLENNHGFTKMSFATPLKRALASMLGVSMAMFENRKWKETELPDLGISPRRLMQFMGTQGGRACSPELWTRMAEREIVQNYLEDAFIVFADVRFDNEAEWIRKAGGKVVEIQRDVAAIASHQSEDGVRPDLVNYTLKNNQGIADIAWKVNGIVWDLGWDTASH